MATVTGKTAAAMTAIADASIVDGAVNGSTGHLILTTHGGDTIDAGNVKGATGATGATGAAGSSLDLAAITTANPTTTAWGNNNKQIQAVADGSSAQHVMTYGQGVKKAGDTLAGYIAPKVVTLTFGTSIAVDASQGNQFRVTLTASTGTLANPTNPVDGQAIVVNVKQDGTGSRTMAFGTAYSFSTSLPSPTLSTAANAKDRLNFIYDANSSKWDFVGFLSGFAA
jgi:hypothetical protein